MLPDVGAIRENNTYISVFRGLNVTNNVGFSRMSSKNSSIYTEFSDMKNMSSDQYPILSTRKPRKRLSTLNDTKIISNLLATEKGLIWIDGAGYLFCAGKKVELEIDKTINHTLVSFGNQVLIFPEKCYVNITSGKITPIEVINKNCECISTVFNDDYDDFWNCSIDKVALNTSITPKQKVLTTNHYINFADSKEQEKGVGHWDIIYNMIHTGDTVESIMSTGDTSSLFMCTNEESNNNYFNNTKKIFTEITSPYTKITATGIGINLKKGDFVKISDLEKGKTLNNGNDKFVDVINNQYYKIYDASDNYIVIRTNIDTSIPYTGKITVEKKMPEDFQAEYMIEVDNRLWTCSSKNNEIYACKQGDCTNWFAFSDGISTDSYALTVGSEGEFTGITRQNSSVIFFKENFVLKIYGNKPSNYALNTYNVSGIEKGSKKSIIWINGVMFYKTRDGIVQYNIGGQPIVISKNAFGNKQYKNAVAGRYKDKYYLSVKDNDNEYSLFVYDTLKGLWHKEDNTRIDEAVTYNGVMYYIDQRSGYIQTPETESNLLDISRYTIDNAGNVGAVNEYGIIGDINGDGNITLADAELLINHIVKIIDLNDNQLKRADTNGNGVEANDITNIQRYVGSQYIENEDKFEWYVITGDLYDSDFNVKKINKINIQINGESGTIIKISAQYGISEEWHELANFYNEKKSVINIPVVVHRSNFMKLKISGIGLAEIYQINIKYTRGSDNNGGI